MGALGIGHWELGIRNWMELPRYHPSCPFRLVPFPSCRLAVSCVAPGWFTWDRRGKPHWLLMASWCDCALQFQIDGFAARSSGIISRAIRSNDDRCSLASGK